MESVFAIFATILLIGAFFIGLFFLTVHPIWAIIDVAIAREKSQGEKIAWILMNLILWTVGSVLYGLIAATRPLLRATRILLAMFLLLIAVFALLAVLVPAAIKTFPDAMRDRVSNRSRA